MSRVFAVLNHTIDSYALVFFPYTIYVEFSNIKQLKIITNEFHHTFILM